MFGHRKKYISDTFFIPNPPKLVFVKLSDLDLSLDEETLRPNTPEHYNWLKCAAEWAEDKWGYMRNHPGIEKRISLLLEKKHFFYLVLYQDQGMQNHLVGTFSLTPAFINVEKEKSFSRKKHHVEMVPKIQTINLSYFYVHENFREHGIGSRMLAKAKQIANANEMVMTAHLLTPNVHGFYKKRNAVTLTEDRSLNEPCVLIRFK